MVQITKLYHTTDAQSFRAFGRVMSGVVRKGMEIKVLGEGYSPEDEEDMMKAVVDDVWIAESRSVVRGLFFRSYSLNPCPLGMCFLPTKFLPGILSCLGVSMPPSRRLRHWLLLPSTKICSSSAPSNT